MEDVNNWLSFYMSESVNHKFAIRRFCPERLMEEQEQDQRAEFQDHETDLCSHDSSISTPFMASSEVDDFVESIINTDQYEHDHDEDPSLDHHHHPTVVNDDDDDVDVVDTYSMMVNDDDDDVYGYNASITMEDEEIETYESVPTTNSEDGELEIRGNSGNIAQLVPNVEKEDNANLGMDQGLDLIHMLLACAEAVGCRDTEQAELLLSRIWGLANPYGDSLQRVSYCFANGLKCRISHFPHNHVPSNGTLSKTGVMDNVPLIPKEKKLEAFQVLCQTTPYIALGFMAANEAIYQSSQGKSSIHIVDLGMEHTLQWPSLLRTLVSRPEGPPKIRITGLIDDGEDDTRLGASMNVLVEEARSLGITLEFQLISQPENLSVLTKERLQLKEGETLIVNSVLQLHKYVKESRGYLKEILQSIKKLNPSAFTVVEQDTNHNGPFFLGRFLESLHYYSAIFDSLEEIMPRNSQQRMKIESFHFADEIRNIVACEGPERRERHERVDKWRRQLGRAGFQVMPLKCTSQARMRLSVYDCDGYTLSCEKGFLLLGWKGRPIMMASAWKVSSL